MHFKKMKILTVVNNLFKSRLKVARRNFNFIKEKRFFPSLVKNLFQQR